MKKYSILLFGSMLALAMPFNTVWGADKGMEKSSVVKKQKPPAIKKATATKKSRVAKKPAVLLSSPATSAVQAVQPSEPPPPPALLAVPVVATPAAMPLPGIPVAASSVATPPAPVVISAIIIPPPIPTVVIPPPVHPSGNPYLQPVLLQPPLVVVPASATNPFGNMKSALSSFLPDGLGQMHAPIFWDLIRGPGKPLLVVQVSCPTKALFGFDTPVIAVLQLGVDQLIAMANDSNLLPAEIQKVCK